MAKRTEQELNTLISRARAQVAAMDDREREAMWKAQRESWVRGEMGIGLDKDEARYRAVTPPR